MNCEGDNGHLRIIGGISYTCVRGTCTNDRGTPAILMRETTALVLFGVKMGLNFWGLILSGLRRVPPPPPPHYNNVKVDTIKLNYIYISQFIYHTKPVILVLLHTSTRQSTCKGRIMQFHIKRCSSNEN